MKAAASRSITIRQPSQMRALASPVRHEIMNVFEATGRCSVADLARSLGRSSHSLHYHIRHLLKVGLLREHSRRPAGRRSEAVYEAVGGRIRLNPDAHDAENARNVRRAVDAMLNLTRREFLRALDADSPRLRGPRRDTFAERRKVWLTGAELARVNALIDELVKVGEPAARDKGSRLHSLLIVLTPAGPDRGTK